MRTFSSDHDDPKYCQRESERLLERYDRDVKPLLGKYLDAARMDDLERDRYRLARTLARSKAELPVCFLGNSNVGKSTLINALLGGAHQVVPSGGIGPLTAQAVEVRWASQPSLTVEYHGAGELNHLAFGLAQSYRTELGAESLATEEGPDETERGVIEDRELRKRRAQLLFTGQQDNERSPGYLIDCLYEAIGQPRRYCTTLLPEDASCLYEVQRRLQLAAQGRQFSKQGWPDDPEFREALTVHVTGYLAPLIKTIRLGWDSHLLIGGMCLVDLPGVGIARDAHRDQTRKWVRDKAQAIVLVVDRAGITESVERILRESEMLNSLIYSADDPEDDPVLVLTITKIDDVAATQYLQDKSRKKREHFAKIVDDIRERHRQETERHLKQMWLEGPQASEARKTVVENVLRTLEVHPVSAPEYFKLQAQDEDDPPFLTEDDQSGIPGLGKCLLDLTSRHRMRHLQALRDSKELFTERLNSHLNLIEAHWESLSHSEEEARQLRNQFEAFLQPLRKELAVRQGSYRNFLKETIPGRIRDLVGKARSEAAREIDRYLQSLTKAHWSTLRASVRRGGRYRGRLAIDLPGEFSLRFEEPIAEVWGKEILKDIRKQTKNYANDCVRLVERASEYALTLGARIEPATVAAHLASIHADAKRLEAVGREMVKEKRDEAKAHLLDVVRKPIEELCEDFVARQRDLGIGVKVRILSLFSDLADRAAEAAVGPATDLLQNQFREVEREILTAFADHQNPLDSLVEAIILRQEKYIERRDAQKRKRALDELRSVRECLLPELPPEADELSAA
jgi:GTP-binding protein EngB required for normal cell division